MAFLGIFVGCWIIVANRTVELNSGDPQTLTIRNVAIAFSVLFVIFTLISLGILWRNKIGEVLGFNKGASNIKTNNNVNTVVRTPATLKQVQPVTSTSSPTKPVSNVAQPSVAARRPATTITINRSNVAKQPVRPTPTSTVTSYRPKPITNSAVSRPTTLTRPTVASKPTVNRTVTASRPTTVNKAAPVSRPVNNNVVRKPLSNSVPQKNIRVVAATNR
ncbi:hypothetical protein [Malacoplasma penetrans]|uniref:hypothetical protein n=1 Tax=Malacoplasma penetrans TaxID=28227 RepID=UPI001011B138|nr:hypothetical protein [Malacoplasma penetrans]